MKSLRLSGLWLLLTAIGAPAAVTHSGPITKFDGVDEIIQACTIGKTYSTIPSMTRTFSISGTTGASVVVAFQGSLSMVGAATFDTGFVRLTIDGVQQSPGEIPAVGAGQNGTHGFNWQSNTLAPGTHTARVQYRTDLGSNFCADARSLIVLHK